jgi:hypothetical protein
MYRTLIALLLLVAGLAYSILLPTISAITPFDEGYAHYEPNTPYQDFIANGCMTGPFYETNSTVVRDTFGLLELGLLYFDPNICLDIAMTIEGYMIDKVEPYGLDMMHMKITLVKK